MAYNMPIGAIIEVAFVGTTDGQTTMSLLHFKLEGDPVSDGALWLGSLIAAIKSPDQLRDLYLDCCAQPYEMKTITAQMIWAPIPNISRRPRKVDVQVDQHGTVEEAMEPSLVAIAVTKRSDLAGRKGIGTLHMPAVPVPFLEQSVLTTAGLVPYSHLADAIPDLISVEGTDARPIIFNRTDPAESPIITSCTVETTARTMMRRVVGRGI